MENKGIELFYLFFQGILCFQVVVFISLYFIANRKELLYYGLFLLFAAVYFFINAPFTFFGIPDNDVWDSDWYDYINTPLIIVENLFYLLFLKNFFADIADTKPIRRLFNLVLWLIPCLVVVFIVLTFFKLDKQFIFYTVKLISVIPSFIVMIVLLKVKPPFTKLVANGLLCTIIGTCVTVYMIILRNAGIHHMFTDGYPLFFIRLGILGDMIFYLIAILKKWHFQEKQLAVEKLQSHFAAEQLRNKISAELHDELGSTLSGISMYSHMVSDMLQSGEYEKAKASVSIIQRSASQVTQNLDDLVWTINPINDSLQTLAERLGEYGREICYTKNMVFVGSYLLKSEEAINNAVKYSNATSVELAIKENNNMLEFSVRDNGNGFDIQQVKKGNGLTNMQRRANEIKALFQLESSINGGTIVRMQVKILPLRI